MARDRYVLLGLGRARAEWFGNVASWATSGAIPADFAKCLSVGEVRQRLAGLQPHSALLVEAGISGLDRDLIDVAVRAGVAVFVIDGNAERAQQWLELGAAVVLPPGISPADLLYALSNHASVISRVVDDAVHVIEEQTAATGALIAVCGPGGTGVSTVAIALAQSFADDVVQNDLVLLADFARNGEQAMLHDSQDIMPGVEELVEASRTRTPNISDVRALTFAITTRRYRLLLGQRRASAWSSMPPRAVSEGVHALRRAFSTVICDVTADFEGERDGGSVDVEERNALARTAALGADAIVVVGMTGMKGTHALARTMRELINAGVDPDRIVPVVNRASKAKRTNAEIRSALSQLVDAPVRMPIFLPDKPVDSALRDGVRLPKQLTEPLLAAVLPVIQRPVVAIDLTEEPQAITPGSLGLLDEAI